MAQSLSPKRRFLSALFGGRKGDRPPVGNPTSIVCLELMEKTGIFFPQAHLDPKQMAELAAAGHEILGFDTVMPEFSVQQEAAALGCEIDWGSPSMMSDAKNHPFQRVEDLRFNRADGSGGRAARGLRAFRGHRRRFKRSMLCAGVRGHQDR